jgi:hypothetical protein
MAIEGGSSVGGFASSRRTNSRSHVDGPTPDAALAACTAARNSPRSTLVRERLGRLADGFAVVDGVGDMPEM